MRVQQRIIVLLIILILVFFIGMWIFHTHHRQQTEIFQKARIQEKKDFFDRTLKLQKGYLLSLVQELSMWEGVAQYINDSQNNALLEALIDEGSMIEASYIWVFNKDAEGIYKTSLPDTVPQNKIVIALDRMLARVKQHEYIHFYDYSNETLTEIYGAPVFEYLSENNEYGDLVGYIFIGNVVDDEYIAALSDLIGGSVVIGPPEPDARFAEKEDMSYFVHPLFDYTDTKIAGFHVHVQEPLLKLFYAVLTADLILYICLALIALIILSLLIMRWVSSPLRRIMHCLHTHSCEPIKKVTLHKSEFGEIAKLLEEFFKQQDELKFAKEKAEHNAAQLAEAHMNLSMAKIKAEEAAETKGRFLANVSHEIRTPLNCIIGFLEIILTTNAVDIIQERANAALKESEALLELINSLLDHAKLEASRMELESIEIDCEQFIAKLEESFRTRIEDKALSFILKTKNMPRYILGDPVRLRQIINNLITNALKFTKEGSITLYIETIEENDNYYTIRFSVIDTGIGISEERKDAIFESFTQADASTTREFGGTGLGTTIAKELVSLMNGTIGVESELGKGSTFWFTAQYPKGRTHGLTPDESYFSTEITDKSDIRMPSGSKVAILLADDYPTNRDILKLHLESCGYEVDCVQNGEEAMHACSRKLYDLVLMDIQMPSMDGFAATRLIRSHLPHYKCIPIVGMTADSSEECRHKCLEVGMNGIITKPVRRVSFLQNVATYIQKR